MPYTQKAVKRAYDMARYYRRQAEWSTGKQCRICGSTEQLCPHHADPDTKDCAHIWSLSEERLQAELLKCIPLCKSCHDGLHGLIRSLTTPLPDHGTEARYARRCRCLHCRHAHAARMRDYKRRVAIRELTGALPAPGAIRVGAE